MHGTLLHLPSSMTTSRSVPKKACSGTKVAAGAAMQFKGSNVKVPNGHFLAWATRARKGNGAGVWPLRSSLQRAATPVVMDAVDYSTQPSLLLMVLMTIRR